MIITTLALAQIYWGPMIPDAAGTPLGAIAGIGNPTFFRIVHVMAWIVVIVSVFSGFEYLWANRAVFAEDARSESGEAD